MFDPEHPGGGLKVLLLENISAVAVEVFRDAGYEVESLKAALDERELIEKIRGVSILGVRSKSRVSKAVLEAASALVSVGAFCIGVDKIDQKTASENGIAVFNDPHSNSRSVAELAMGEIILLLRRTFQASTQMHSGAWNKSAAGAHEVRGLTLGIVGYGKIGSQLSDLAEAMGMRVIFYDSAHVLARGNARSVSFRELLETADVVTLHVDGKPQNKNLFGADEFAAMKEGACFLNLSRGFVVDHEALAACLKSGKVAGAAIDVFPSEPESGAGFKSALQGLPNVILTPHVGGSTEEAQQNIGSFVSAKLLDYVRTGDSTLSVNLPSCHLEYEEGSYRLMHVHQNVPGILRAINDILGDRGINIERQSLNTRGTLGYAIYDINRPCDAELMGLLRAVPHTIAVRAKGC
ncbi:MAG TPA: phosphoglycerate dehydrogenase [Candidatus Sulfotelmatobacter sp.]|nr:phosphoglycerate dehydrogenase [Candidatus Sulfotelmatobacter sp.]